MKRLALVLCLVLGVFFGLLRAEGEDPRVSVRVTQVALPAQNLPKLSAFYGKVLGLKFEEETLGTKARPAYVRRARLGSIDLLLVESESKPLTPHLADAESPVPAFTLVVDSARMKRCLASVNEAGGTAGKPFGDQQVSCCVLSDPEGNTFQIQDGE